MAVDNSKRTIWALRPALLTSANNYLSAKTVETAGSFLRWMLKRNLASSFSRSRSCHPDVFDSLSTPEQVTVDYSLLFLALCTLSCGLTLYLGDRTSLEVRIITISFQSRGQQLCKLLGIEETFNMWKEFDSHWIFFVHKHDRWFIVLYTNMAVVTSCENDL